MLITLFCVCSIFEWKNQEKPILAKITLDIVIDEATLKECKLFDVAQDRLETYTWFNIYYEQFRSIRGITVSITSTQILYFY